MNLTNEQLMVLARKVGLKPITAEVYDEYKGFDDEGEPYEMQLEAYVYDYSVDPVKYGKFKGWCKIGGSTTNSTRSEIYLSVGNTTWSLHSNDLVFIPKEIETITDHILPHSLLNGPETSSNHRIIPYNESYKTPKKSDESHRSRRNRH